MGDPPSSGLSFHVRVAEFLVMSETTNEPSGGDGASEVKKT